MKTLIDLNSFGIDDKSICKCLVISGEGGDYEIFPSEHAKANFPVNQNSS
jgi:hypothetical protein